MSNGSQTGLIKPVLGLWLLFVSLPAQAADEVNYRWLLPKQTIFLCQTIAAPVVQCARLEAGSNGVRLSVIQSIRNGVGNRTYLRVRSPVGEDGFVDGADPVLASSDPNRLQGNGVMIGSGCASSALVPQIGMTRTQVDASCWGKPEKIVTTSTLTLLQEDYLYKNGRALRLVNGLVSLKIDQR